ncbi:MAG TPA: hypothetical protein VN814_08270 [Caulobacteraceae bacterium]|nr:hypothetical protein [Caulobacteraceae bacterium]
MRETPSADVLAIFSAGKSGPYPNPYLTDAQLLELSAICLQSDRAIHTVEAFAITEDADTARPEFSLLDDPPGGWADTWQERARRSHEEIVELVTKVREQPDRIVFEVWLDWE